MYRLINQKTKWKQLTMVGNVNISPTATFKIKQNYLSRRVFNFRNSVYKWLTRKSLPLFFRSGDVISMTPIANGVYETNIKFLVDYLAENGYSDFFIDIGANIGLTSCQSGNGFKEVHLFEPNPDCVHILKVNTKIALSGTNYTIHEYGLGNTNEFLKLHVPRNNWGGAFIKHASNSYSDKILANKDGFSTFDEKNYFQVDIEIKIADDELKKLFSDLSNRSQLCGVIKIDVEGFELPILKSIVNSLPADIKLVVIFENWGHPIDIKALKRADQNIILKRMVNKKQIHSLLPRWLNSICLFLMGGYDIVLTQVEQVASVGDYILEVTS